MIQRPRYLDVCWSRETKGSKQESQYWLTLHMPNEDYAYFDYRDVVEKFNTFVVSNFENP